MELRYEAEGGSKNIKPDAPGTESEDLRQLKSSAVTFLSRGSHQPKVLPPEEVRGRNSKVRRPWLKKIRYTGGYADTVEEGII